MSFEKNVFKLEPHIFVTVGVNCNETLLAYSEVAIFWFESHFQACCCFIISHLTHVGVTYLNNNSYSLYSTMILRWVYESKRHYLKKLTFIKDVQICNHFKVKRNLDLRMLSLMFQMWGLINFMVVEIFQFFIVFFLSV